MKINGFLFFAVLLLYPLATVQMEDQVFKGRLPYRNGLIQSGDDISDDIEMGSSESESNTASNDGDCDEKCSITSV